VTAAERTSLEITEGLAHLKLARGDRRNAIDRALVDSLSGQVTRALADSRVRALLISADGPSFTVGGDLRHLGGELDRLPDELDSMITIYHRTLAQLAECHIPVVVAAQGGAAGGGLGLLWCADVVIAADDLRVASGFAHLGLSGDGGSSWHLPRLVGLRRAQQLILGERVLDAEEALDWGLVTRVVPAAELADEAMAQARALASGPTFSLGQMKQLLLASWSHSYPDQLAAERDAIVRCGATDDAREGLTAFEARRAPRFQGR
jgi:2-(1,2-epoxy-1,2-dihydrophenyl)acetyl-CoA isomerase